jgi:hypothetical protein
MNIILGAFFLIHIHIDFLIRGPIAHLKRPSSILDIFIIFSLIKNVYAFLFGDDPLTDDAHELVTFILHDICIVRIFDILKILSMIDALKDQLKVMWDTLTSVIMFFFLFSLFVFIYR